MRRDKEPSEVMIKIRDAAELVASGHLLGAGFLLAYGIFFRDEKYMMWDPAIMWACLSAGIYFACNAFIKLRHREIQRTLDECKSDMLFQDINTNLRQELSELVMRQKKDQAIARYREETGRGQKKAKAVIEYLADTME